MIQLPENLFFGTFIVICILVMAKNKTENKILFIDASKEYKKETNNNILEEKNIQAIVKEFRNRTDKEYFSRYAGCPPGSPTSCPRGVCETWSLRRGAGTVVRSTCCSGPAGTFPVR